MKFFGKLDKHEYALWAISALIIVISFIISNTGDYLNLIASLVGVSALIFMAKGYPVCHVLFVVFAILYAIISYDLHYYGEMITYVGMSLPVSVISLISWLRHPYLGTAEVKVQKLNSRRIWLTIILTIIVTVIFYFILKILGTANLLVSTISVSTSFLAAFLSFLRSPYYAIGYALNDIVLIILWAIATASNITYLSVLVCFCVFFFNDLYGFISWKKRQKRQSN